MFGKSFFAISFLREEINNLSRQTSLRRLNSVSTDPRAQVQTHYNNNTPQTLGEDPPKAAGFSTHGATGKMVDMFSLKAASSDKSMSLSDFMYFPICAHVSALFLSRSVQSEDYASLRVDSRMKNSQMSLVSPATRLTSLV